DTPLSIEPFFPEVVKSLEAGIKFTAWDRRLRANLALFHMNIDNVQRSVLLIEPTTNSPYASVFNAAKSRVRGLELDVSLEPVKGLTFGGTLGLMDPKYKRFVDPASGADRSDLDFPSSPKRTYSLSAAYQTEVSDGVDVLFRADWSHRSRMVWDVFNSPLTVQKPYGLLNGRVQLDVTPEVLGARFGIALFGRNLTDRKYNTYATTAGGGFYVRNEDRRTIGVEVTAGF
ncbi:MAG: TonB-dependent receptor, partial [Novosphingobium sp.]|nr:TonB-dependent receptor [Novosphingobium sp.]